MNVVWIKEDVCVVLILIIEVMIIGMMYMFIVKICWIFNIVVCLKDIEFFGFIVKWRLFCFFLFIFYVFLVVDIKFLLCIFLFCI